MCALFDAPQEEMWRKGVGDFSTTRIGSLKAHLKGGGELRINVDPEKPHVMAAVQQGPADHRRTRKDGCVTSVIPTCEGDMGLISRSSAEKEIFFSRTDTPRGRLLTVVQYKYNRKPNEGIAVEPDASLSTIRNVVTIMQGTSRMSGLGLYLSRAPGQLSVKIPLIFSHLH